MAGNPAAAPRNFLDAISQIERFAAIEAEGGQIPEGMLTTKQRFEYWETGFISTLQSGLVSVLFTPLAIGVVERHIPVFMGDGRADWFDTLLVFALALSFTIGYAVFLARLGRYYRVPFTKWMIRSFLGGVYASAAVKIVFAMVLFHFLALFVCEPARAAAFVLTFRGWVSWGALQGWYEFLVGFREVFILSAWFIAATTLLYVAAPIASISWAGWRQRRMETGGGR